jgi:Ca2+-binding RTX toxin-like protein
MATYKLDLNNANYNTEALSYYLWGQDAQPSYANITKDKWIGKTEEITLNVDPNQFLNKYGHLFNVKDFKLTEVFFNGETAGGNILDINSANGYILNTNGEYELTHEQFVNLYYRDSNQYLKVLTPEINPSFYNRGLDDADFAKRAFVFETTTVAVDTDKVKYILDQDLNPLHIENFDMVINQNGDNFDFQGGPGSSSANQILQQVADPSGIGKTVNLDFGGGAVKKMLIITKEDFENIPILIEDDKPRAYFLFFKEFERMRGTGVIDYLDDNGRVIIFNGSGDGNITGTKAANFDISEDVEIDFIKYGIDLAPDSLVELVAGLNHYKPHLHNGITYVGGDGIDIIRGTDLLLGNADTDILEGGNEADTLIGGAGYDVLVGGTIYSEDDAIDIL